MEDNKIDNEETAAEKAIRVRLARRDRQLDKLIEALAENTGVDVDTLRVETERVAKGADIDNSVIDEQNNKIEVVKNETAELKESWQARYNNMVMKSKLRDAFEVAGGAAKAWKSAHSLINNIDDGMAFGIDEHENLIVINKYNGERIAADSGEPFDPAKRIRNMLKDNDYLVRSGFDKRRLLIDSPDYWKMRRQELNKIATAKGRHSPEYKAQRQEMIDEINSMNDPQPGQKKTAEETLLELGRRMKAEGKSGKEIAIATGTWAED